MVHPPTGRGRAIRVSAEGKIRELVSSTQLQGGGKLPAERDLAEQFGVSRTTIRQILDGLEREGVVERRRGRSGGTFVIQARVDLDFGQLASIPSYLRAQGFRAGAHVVSARMLPATASTAQALEIRKGDLVYDLVRVRLADDVRISLEHARFPVALFPDMLSQKLDESVYELMAERYGRVATKAVERLMALIADAEHAEALGAKVGDPLMAIERIAYAQDGQPLEYSNDLFRGDRTRVIAWAYGADQTRDLDTAALHLEVDWPA